MDEIIAGSPCGMCQVPDELSGWLGDIGRYGKSGEIQTYLSYGNGKGAPAISLSAPSLGIQTADDTNMVLGGGLSDDFAHFLKVHPGMSIEEAKCKFKEQQKLKVQMRKGPKMHH